MVIVKWLVFINNNLGAKMNLSKKLLTLIFSVAIVGNASLAAKPVGYREKQQPAGLTRAVFGKVASGAEMAITAAQYAAIAALVVIAADATTGMVNEHLVSKLFDTNYNIGTISAASLKAAIWTISKTYDVSFAATCAAINSSWGQRTIAYLSQHANAGMLEWANASLETKTAATAVGCAALANTKALSFGLGVGRSLWNKARGVKTN